MANCQTHLTQTQSWWSPGWSTPGFGPQGAHGHHLCSPKRHPLAPAAPGDALRLRSHLLASASALATTRCLEEAALEVAPGTGRPPWHRLVQVYTRQPVIPRGFWGALTGKNPTDRAKKGTKRHLSVDRHGVPLALLLTGAQRHDSTQAMRLLDAIPPLKRRHGHRRNRPDAAYADRAYGTPACHAGLRKRHIEDHFATPRQPHGSGLGKVRQVVERALCWLGQARRLKIRYEKLPSLHLAFHYLQMTRMCCRILERRF